MIYGHLAEVMLSQPATYETGSKVHGIARGSTAIVLSTDARQNTVTVQRENGQAVTYDPRRLKGVNAYLEMEKPFATGDRIQFTAKTRLLVSTTAI